MSDYTPTTEEVRDYYLEGRDGRASADFLNGEHPFAEFDRWLAAHDAEIRADERGKIDEQIDALPRPQRNEAGSEFVGGWFDALSTVVTRILWKRDDAAARGDGSHE